MTLPLVQNPYQGKTEADVSGKPKRVCLRQGSEKKKTKQSVRHYQIKSYHNHRVPSFVNQTSTSTRS